MYNYIFGPIQSRRFGLSLGIDLSPDTKSCNFDCLYCELSSSKRVDRIENPPLVDAVTEEVKSALLEYPSVDVITITANGEPTLYPDLSKLVDRLISLKGEKKLLILSNASGIGRQEIQESLQKIDIVKLSLDCATQKCFQKIDRPQKSLLVKEIIEGLVDFRASYTKELVLEILVVEGINDTKEEMLALKEAIEKIKPDRIDLGTIDRPPAYGVKGVEYEKLKALASYLGRLPISIVHKEPASSVLDFSKEEILSMLSRRPQSEMDVEHLFSKSSQELLQILLKEQKVRLKEIAGVRFYVVA